jgi:chromosome segregation ATPase
MSDTPPPADADRPKRRTAYGLETDHATWAEELLPTLTTALGKHMFAVVVVEEGPAQGPRQNRRNKRNARTTPPTRRPRKRRPVPGQLEIDFATIPDTDGYVPALPSGQGRPK